MVFQVLDESNLSLVPLDQLAEIVVECFNAPPWNEQWTQETGRDVILSFLKKRVDVVLLSDEAGQVVSVGIGLPLADYSSASELHQAGVGSDSYYISALATRRATRQKGACSRCFQGLLDAGQARGFLAVCTRTRFDNENALRIFRKFGLLEVGRMVASTGGVQSERIIFARSLLS